MGGQATSTRCCATSTSCPTTSATPVRNNAGGHSNHSFFWQIMSPDGGGEPEGDLAAAIDDAFGSFDAFKDEFKNAGVEPVRLRLVVAGPRRLGPGGRLDGQPGLADLRRPDAAARRRRLGARLLPEVPEQAPRLHRRLVERRQLGRGGQPVRRGPDPSKPRHQGAAAGRTALSIRTSVWGAQVALAPSR